MKECPTCGRLFPDPSLRFCRMDGSRLVNKGARADEALTVLFTTGRLEELKSSRKKAQKAQTEY